MYICIELNTLEILKKESLTGTGSNPYICFRWNTCAGEVYGRGPIFNCLSAIKTTNLTVESILNNAAMAISGIYQMDDDGVINPDTINLVPGTVIPKAPNSAGLQPIKQAGDLNFTNFVLSDMRQNIKRALYNDMLGNPDRTPASATEVVEIPTINGRQIKVKSVSPLAQAQSNQDISAIARWLELVGGSFGPQTVNLLVNTEETAAHLARKFGVPDTLIRDLEERKLLVQTAQQLAQQQMMQPQNMEQAPDEQAAE